MLKHLRPNVFTLKSLLHLGQNVITCRTLLHLGSFITLAEREVKDSRRSGMSPKLLFWGQDWARKVCRFYVLFDYLTK